MDKERKCKTRKIKDQSKIQLLGDQVTKNNMAKFIGYKLMSKLQRKRGTTT